MITRRLQLTALLVGILFLVMMIELIRKNRVSLKYALLWLFSGAVMLLRRHALREESARMASEATELSLSASPAFMEHYIDCMTFDTF